MNEKSKTPFEKEDSDFGLPQNSFNSVTSNRSRPARITVVSLSILVAVGLGVSYVIFHHLSGSHPKEEPRLIGKDHESAPLEEDPTYLDREGIKTDDVPSHFASPPPKGAVTRVKSPQGCYYVVVGSYIDEDFASNHADFLAKQGVDVVLIEPTLGKYFYLVAVDQADSLHRAQEKAKNFNALGGNIWIKKY